MKRIAWALLSLVLLWPVAARAVPLQEMNLPTDVPWTIQAEQFASEDEGKVIVAHGRVVLRQKTDRITAEHIRIDLRTRNIDAWGDVAWYHGSDIIQGERVKIDLNSSTGKVYKGRIFLSSNHFYITAREMDKTGPDTYSMRQATLTSCDGSSPDWLIKSSVLKVTVDGYGRTWWPEVKLGGLPVFTFPWAVFPAKTKRQSGFLSPNFYDSNRDGFAFELPFYWAWADWGETTFHWQHSDRGEGLGTELKFKLGSNKDVGLFYFDYLNDRKAEEFHEAGDLNKSETNRYWIRGMLKADKLLPYKVKLNLIVDVPSDIDFIREFQYWGTGLNKDNREFSRYFGTTLDDDTEYQRLNRFQLRRYWTGSYAAIDAQYLFDPTLRTEKQRDDTFQKLPDFIWNFSDKPIGETSLYYNFRVRSTNRWREKGEWGQNTQGRANLYGVYSLGPYLNLVPSTAFQTNFWHVEPEDELAGPQDGGTTFRTRLLWEAGMELSTSIFKIYDVNGTTWKRIKHLIKPTISLAYRPQVYDPAPTTFSEKAGPVEQISWGLSTTLTVKELKGQNRLVRLEDELWRRRNFGRIAMANWGLGDEDFVDYDDEELRTELSRRRRLQALKSSPSYRYREFVRLELSQTYDLYQARIKLDPGVIRRPFSYLKAQLWLNPSSYFRVRALVEYDPHTGKWPRLNFHTRIRDSRGDSIGFHYRRRWIVDEVREDVRQFYVTAGVQLFGPLSANGEWVYNMITNKSVSQTFSVALNRQCWGIGLVYSKTEDDERYGIFFTLLGLGEVYRYDMSRSRIEE